MSELIYNNEEFKLLLNKLLNSELEQLRRKFLPYKRKPFLRNKVEILIGKYEKGVMGYYENTRKDDRQLRFEHKIYITSNQISTYKNYVEWGMKRIAIKDLKEIIRHELIHAFVYEEFEMWEFIKGMERDYSPIYLSCLYWSNGVTHHKYANKFLETDLWKDIKVCKKYDDVYIKLMKYIISLEKCISDINREININPYIQKELNIEFNYKGAGIIKKVYLAANVIAKQDSKVCKCKATTMTLGVGFLVTADILKKNYQRKFENGVLAKMHCEEIAYMKGNEVKHKSNIRNNIV